MITVMWAQIVNTLIGIWLMVSPSILGYPDGGADSNYITGPITSTIATVAAWEATRGLAKLNLISGVWLLIAPWVLGYEPVLPILNDMLCGILISILAIIKVKNRHNYAGGWTMLFN